jgi:outer membrane protein OmpA-like peptidoglycan-associated protein
LKNKLLLVSGIAFSLSAFAQTASQTVAVEPMSYTPTFRVTVVSRSVQAVNYKHRGGATKIDFAGTDLMPQANGQAKVESKKGYIEIEVEFGNLDKPTAFGNEYLTYVLWAISPEGRSVNLGEILVGDNHRSKVDVTTDLQAFALVVTAEPYFAVRQPSNVVVLENIVRDDTRGTIEALHTKYELLERGGYIPTGYKFDPVILNAKLPLEFFEARNALRIAQSEGAETNAVDSYKHAVELMDRVDADATAKHTDKKAMIAVAREAVQTAEDARAISVKKIEQDRLDNERQTSANNLANTQAQADDAARQRDDATRMKEQAQSDQARAELAKHAAESDAAKARNEAMDAQAAADKAKADMADSQASSANALSAAQADAERSRLAAQQAQANEQQADAEKIAMRTKLAEQLNRILQTRDSARGLIVSLSDVLFDTGKYALKSGAREKLAKVAGILLAYPGLNIEVGGYTDNVGGDQMNQTLSENRAGSVRDYLVQQGVANNSVSAKGFGNTLPVATNNDSAGRQQNRRVELLVSGEAIGNPVNATTGSLR